MSYGHKADAILSRPHTLPEAEPDFCWGADASHTGEITILVEKLSSGEFAAQVLNDEGQHPARLGRTAAEAVRRMQCAFMAHHLLFEASYKPDHPEDVAEWYTGISLKFKVVEITAEDHAAFGPYLTVEAEEALDTEDVENAYEELREARGTY